MKKILKLSLASLCATGAVVSTQAHNDSDKNLVVTEPAGADNSRHDADTSFTGVTGWQGTYQGGSSYNASYGTSMQGQQIYEAAGAAPMGAPHMVTGREQDCYADCILKQYQLGKGAARATDEHYWNNVPSDRMYAQYPASGASYQNYAYTGYSSQGYSSQPMSSSAGFASSTTIHSARPTEGWSGSQGLWYAPDGRVYNAQGQQVSGQRSGSFSEPAGSSPSSYNQSGSQSSGASIQSSQSSSRSTIQSESSGAQPGASSSSSVQPGSSDQSSASSSDQSLKAQSAATQSGTSGAQSSTELKGSQGQQPGSATSEAAGAQPSTDTSTQPSSTSSSDNSAQPSSTSSSSDQSSTQSSTSSSPSAMSDKVRSTLKSDSTLSPISSNVQVQDQNGKVALSGTVKSEAEKQQIVSKAEETAGSGNVIDNLQVQSDNNSGNSNSSNPSNP